MTQPLDNPPYVAQIGGNHYGTKYGHWDYCKDAGTGYLEGHATKYLYRWRRKGGIQDLEKALSFVEKLTVGNEETNCDRGQGEYADLLDRFFDENDVPFQEKVLIMCVINWEKYSDLVETRNALVEFISAAVKEATMSKLALNHDDATRAYVNQG